jgi:16S rRNA (cytidine1402-2'-O)-methyltransferase
MLYLVSTPIGNLKDLGIRALEILKGVNLIICERPRHTLKLLSYYQIKDKRLISYTEANKSRQIPFILKLLENQDAAFVADAGTIGVSDPGPELVEAARKQGIEIRSVPGPSAITSAIALTGERINKFLFVGFLPKKQKELKELIELIKERKIWLAAYEAPHRLEKTIKFFNENFPEACLTLVSEISKIYEKVLKGSPEEILNAFSADPKLKKGEFVMFIKRSKDVRRP